MNNNKCYIQTLCSFYEQISNGEIFSQENMTCQKKLFCFLERTSEEIFCDKMTRAASLKKLKSCQNLKNTIFEENVRQRTPLLYDRYFKQNGSGKSISSLLSVIMLVYVLFLK